MARQLQVQGRSVALLALLDSYPDLRNSSASAARADTSSTPMLVKDYAGPIVRMVGSLKRYWEAQVEVSYEDLCLLQPDEQLVYFLDRLRGAQVVPDDLDLSQLRRYIQVHEAHDFCLQKYQPQPYAGRITLLRTENAEHDPSLWASFSSEPVEVHTVPGDHFSMVVEPYVQSLAVQLQKCLDKADGV